MYWSDQSPEDRTIEARRLAQCLSWWVIESTDLIQSRMVLQTDCFELVKTLELETLESARMS